MAQINTYSDIQSFVNTIFEDALFVARDNNLMSALVLNFTGQGMAPRKVQQYNQGTAKAIGESDDLTSDAFTPTALSTLTPSEVGLQFFLTDQRLESDPFGARDDAARELGLAIADKIESDLLGDLASLTGGTVGTAGSAMSWSYFFAALSRLRAQKAPRPYYCVLHPYQWHDLATAVTPAGTATNAPEFQNAAMRDFYVQTVAGVQIYVTANVSIDTSDDAIGAMFSREALALDMRRAPRLEPERDASRRGWELNMTAVYAHGVWRPTWGIKIISDATAP
ncbi:MAG TPA: hypothetical protein PLZ94_19340 [Armatimonadota bacterium]|nr:hypothetical protein [Armatimonadota bacterium]